MQDDPGNEQRPPADFSVEDILRAPRWGREPDEAAAARRQHVSEARAALWELDFALQELEWLRRGAAREALLVRSIASQIDRTAGGLAGFPPDDLPLPDDLREALAERFARLAEAIRDLPDEWVDDEAIAAARDRLRAHLEVRGVDVG
jgi:hypothetical protein